MKNIFILHIESNRIFGLDILRAAAIFFVVLGHGNSLLPKIIRNVTGLLVFDGVSIFFVLSGFLIGGILLKSLRDDFDIHSLLNFWIRRWFRTLPNYFFVLCCLVFLNLIYNENFKLNSIGIYLLFSQNLFFSHPSFFPEAWSLAVEEWFYFLIPLLVLALILFKVPYRKSILTIAFSIIIAVTFFRYLRFETISVETYDDWDLLFRKQVVTRLDSLMFGVIGAYINHYHLSKWSNYRILFLSAGLLLFLLNGFVFPLYIEFNSLYNCVFSFSVISIATLFMLPFLSTVNQGHGFLYKLITYTSLTSYSMYLINLSLIHDFIIMKIPWTLIFESQWVIIIIRYGLYWFLVIMCSILLFKYFEIPITRLRDNISIRLFLKKISR